MVFFFFKQKTAYVMRISDWSSDVCSSDLAVPALRRIRGYRQLSIAGLEHPPLDFCSGGCCSRTGDQSRRYLVVELHELGAKGGEIGRACWRPCGAEPPEQGGGKEAGGGRGHPPDANPKTP